jgi:hypothetical protein
VPPLDEQPANTNSVARGMEVNIAFMEPTPLGSRTIVRDVFPTTTVSPAGENRLTPGVREKYAIALSD